VLSPTIDLALAGVGAPTPGGGQLHPHAMAVVLRVATKQGRSILLSADIDHSGMRGLLEDPDVDLTANVLVYPHHGGRTGAGSDEQEESLAREFTAAVDPEAILVSNGRERFQNPRREIVRGVRQARSSPPVRLVCTQLSSVCLAEVVADPEHLDPTLSSLGATKGMSCTGSIRVDLSGTGPVLPNGASHLDFVVNRVGESALCLSADLLAKEGTGADD
jgi:hypothetical protein